MAMAAPPSRFNFAQHVADLNASRLDKAAYLDDTGSLTYDELARHARQIATALLDLGLRREERVFVCLHDTIDYPRVFLGALHAGVVPVCANTLLVADDYAYMLEHSRAQALIVSGPLLPVLQQAMSQAAHEVRHVIVSRPAGDLPQGAREFGA